MTSRRLVFVVRQFWPFCGGPQTALSNLGAELIGRGHRVTVLTARWQADWPAEIDYHGIRVIRLPHPAGRLTGKIKFLRNLLRWLAAQRSQFDLAYVSALRHEACTAVAAGQQAGFPIVLRAEGAGFSGDCHWQLDALFGRRIKRRCFQAEACVAPSPAIERELIAAGYPRERIHGIPNGVKPAAKATAAARIGIRRTLTESDPRWAAPGESPVAVFCGQLLAAKGLQHLLEAWRTIVAKRSDARLWIVGDGPERPRLERLISDLGLTGRAALTGAIDQVKDFLLAADLFVLPSLEEGTSLALLEAMSHALPIVASDVPGNRAVVRHEVEGLLVPSQDPASLAAAIQRIWGEPDLADRLGAAAAIRVRSDFSLATMANRHEALFENVLAKCRPRNP